MSLRKSFFFLITTMLLSISAFAQNNQGNANCSGLPGPGTLRTQLIATPGFSGAGMAPPVGGIFNGTLMWASVVNRSGQICTTVASQSDPTQVWPGSQAIAKAKAYTANAFSLDTFALSSARLFTLTQPGHSLFSLGQSNPFKPNALAAPGAAGADNGEIDGGLIFFGGGVPLYNSSGKIVGGLGVSGDTSCADHEVAKRLRHLLNMDPPGGPLVDDIVYSSDGPLPPPLNIFIHPVCFNTYRNGAFIGQENAPTGY